MLLKMIFRLHQVIFSCLKLHQLQIIISNFEKRVMGESKAENLERFWFNFTQVHKLKIIPCVLKRVIFTLEFSDYLLAVRLPNFKETLKQHRPTVKIIFSCCLSQLFQVFWEILSDVSLTIIAKEVIPLLDRVLKLLKMINYRSLVLLTGFIYW